MHLNKTLKVHEKSFKKIYIVKHVCEVFVEDLLLKIKLPRILLFLCTNNYNVS